jgi:hypothetical protein
MKRFLNPTLILMTIALAVGFVLGCNTASDSPEGKVQASAAPAPPRPEDYVDSIRQSVTDVQKSVEELAKTPELQDVAKPVLIAAACQANGLPLETYRYITETETDDPVIPTVKPE